MSRQPTLRIKLRRDIRSQRALFAAIVTMVLLGVGLFAATYDAYQNLRATYAAVFEQERFADLFVTGGDVKSYAATVGTSASVEAVTIRTQADLPIWVGDDKFGGRVIGYPASGDPAVDRVTLLEGRGLDGPYTALVEHHMAEHFGLEPGDQVRVVGIAGPQQLTISGVVSTAEYLWPARSRQEPFTLPSDFGVLFVSEDTARHLSGVHAPNQALVRLTDAARADNDGEKALAALSHQAQIAGASEVLTRDEQPSNSLLQMDIDGFQQMSISFPLLFLSAAGLATYVLLTRRVQAERPIVGMLRAQGTRSRTIGRHYLEYGVAAGLLGAVLGLVFGLLGARGLSRLYVQVIDLPAQAAVIETGRPATLLGGLAFGLSVGALAALAPARRAARTPPAEAMRGAAPAVPGGLTLPERLIPGLRRLPARWQLVLRGISRNRKRSLFTATGVALALTLILVSWTMYDTMRVLMNDQFGAISKQDAQVDFAEPVGEPQLQELSEVSGVRSVEPLVQQPVTLSLGSGSYATLLSGLEPDTGMHGFTLVGGAKTTLPSDGILVGRALQDEIAVRVGDEVSVRFPVLGREVSARVVGLLDEPLGTFAYASTDWLAAEVGQVPAMSALLNFEPGADRQEIRRAVLDLPGAVTFTDSQALKQLWDDYAGLFYAFIGGMLVLGGLMAFAIIFTTMSVNIVERRRELATLRAAGVRHRVLARIVARENFLVALMGVLPGLVLGILGGTGFLSTYNSDQFHLDLVVLPTTLLISTLAILVVAALSQWPGLRAVRHMNIAEAVRERGD